MSKVSHNNSLLLKMKPRYLQLSFGHRRSPLQKTLLSLELPSCIVVPIRDLGNKSFSSSAIMHSQQDSDLTLPTVLLINHTEMDNSPG